MPESLAEHVLEENKMYLKRVTLH